MSESARVRRIGAAQLAEVYLDRAATVAKDCDYIRRAGDLGLDLLVFPEYHVPASPKWFRHDPDLTFEEYYRRLLDEAVTPSSPAVDRLSEAAADAECAVVVGVNWKETPGAGTLYNAQLYLDADGSVLGVRRKLVPTLYERLVHAGGSGADVRVFDSSVGTLGGLLCGEHLNHLLAFALLAQGQELHAASWPRYVGYDREALDRLIGVRTRFHAEAAKAPTALAMGTVTDDLADAIGKPSLSEGPSLSAVVGPTGEYLAGPKFDGEGIVHAEVDLADRALEHSHHDLAGHYNRFDVFDLHVDREARTPVTFEGEGPDDRR
ncbi:MAG: nitrilase-related carbon-nitrogen hydrolase [Haloplanus sp.]